MQYLGSTPMYLEKPIYTPYQFNRISLGTTKTATVNYYVIDRISKSYTHGTYDTNESKNFRVTYNLHDKDRNRWSHLSDTDKEEDLTTFEEAPVTVKLSSNFKEFSQKPLPKVDEIRAEILEDRNIALANYKKNTFETKPSDDSRLESVVVIHHPGGGVGTGFYVTDDLILSNFHVIEGTKYVEMKLYNGQETFGKVVGYDIRLDLALIKSQARGKPLDFYDQRKIPLGQSVEAIGHPGDLDFTITRGIISALRVAKGKYAPGGKPIRFIQTDAAINPGNSGGPLLLGNKVIGINTLKRVGTDIEGIGFAIHYSEILNFLNSKK